MKFSTFLLAAFASVASAQYCPITSGQCDTSKVPASPKTGEITRQFLVDGFSCSGTIEIVNECTFNVKGFSIVSPGSNELKWYGAEVLNSSKGGNALTATPIAQSSTKQDITVTTGDNMFCRASLIEHVGAISIMDDQYRVICFAELKSSGAGAPAASTGSTGSTGNTSSTGATGAVGAAQGSFTNGSSTGAQTGSNANVSTSTKPGNTTASATPAAGKVTSGAKSLSMIPSALYVALLSLVLYLRN